jgi:hypothetical protein
LGSVAEELGEVINRHEGNEHREKTDFFPSIIKNAHKISSPKYFNGLEAKWGKEANIINI